MMDADSIREVREYVSRPEVERDRLMRLAETATVAWSTDPNIPAVETLRTCSNEAGELAMAKLCDLGYHAGWVISGDGEFRFALDEKDAPTPERAMERFG